MLDFSNLTAVVMNPAVTPVWFFLGAITLHVLVGGLLHLVRLKDFDWHELGNFVENDFASKRGLAILATASTTLATTFLPGADVKAAFLASWLAFAAACGAAVLPVLRDTFYDFVQLVSGSRPVSGVQVHYTKPATTHTKKS